MDPLQPRLRAAGLVKEVFAPAPLEGECALSCRRESMC